MLDLDGQWFVQASYGTADWTPNLRAAGEATVIHPGGDRTSVQVIDLPPDDGVRFFGVRSNRLAEAPASCALGLTLETAHRPPPPIADSTQRHTSGLRCRNSAAPHLPAPTECLVGGHVLLIGYAPYFPNVCARQIHSRHNVAVSRRSGSLRQRETGTLSPRLRDILAASVAVISFRRYLPVDGAPSVYRERTAQVYSGFRPVHPRRLPCAMPGGPR
jgi:hypothetical protein